MQKDFPFIHILLYIFLALAIVGLADSAYLTNAYYTGSPLSCETIPGCNEVAKSPYTQIAGVSLPVLGVIYYTFTIFNALLYLFRRTTYASTLLAYLTTLGFFVSAYFTYVQVELIKAVCIYCMSSAVIATILFGIGTFIRKHHLEYHDGQMGDIV